VQGKTGEKLWIPMHPELAQVLRQQGPAGSILTTSFGKEFTDKGFSNFMADKIGEAGLPERCVTHGLRKAAARRLAEAGCSSKEIAAITGHRTLKESERYTKAAEQRHLAVAAIGRLGARPLIQFPNQPEGLGKTAMIVSKNKALGKGWESCRVRQD
jgi:integrase